MNITEDGLKKYIETYHQELDDKASLFLDSDTANLLLHRSLLPAKIICYISTQLGVAIEYTQAETTSIKTVRGSARVEDLFVGAPRRLSKTPTMFKIEGENIKIMGGTFEGAFPFRLGHSKTSVVFSNVKFSSQALNWEKNIEYAEVNGNRDQTNWSEDSAKSRAKDEILAALFDIKQAEKQKVELHEYISSSKEKNVLVLGSYDSEGEKRISSIYGALQDLGYNPILIKDIPDFEHYDIPQKVTAIGALSRFIVIDDSSPSGHLVEVEICKSNRWVTIILRADGNQASFMTVGASNTSNVILEKEYKSISPIDDIKGATQWAEAKLVELEKKLNDQYPWRK